MRLFFISAFILIASACFAQSKTDSTSYDYGMRIYDTRPCGGCPSNNKTDEPKLFINPYEGFTNNPIMLDSLPDSTKTMLLKLLHKFPDSLTVDKLIL